ncbi:unnamed protein product [Camellia sinensis]
MKYNQVTLNCGSTIPIMALGTYSSQNDREETKHAVQTALKMGYRHFDTAKIYGSEAAVGEALTESILNQTVEREDIFLTSKLWGSDHHDPVSGLTRTLKEVGDGTCRHVPGALASEVEAMGYQCCPSFEPVLDLETTWGGMERCLDMGLCRSIGVSNFSTNKIQRLLDFASIPPAVNQVEMHPRWRQTKLREFCGDHNIHISAYSPLGGPGNAWGSTAVVDDPIIQSIALEHKATPAQVALGWGLSKGASVIVKSFNKERMKENMGALDLRLDDHDLLNIEMMEERKIMRGEFLVNQTTSPYKTIQDLWDDEI